MLKIALIVLLTLAVLICAYFAILSLTSKPVYTGVSNNKLGPCGSKPNCVNSDHQGEKHIAPISLESIPENEIWNKTTAAIKASGGNILEQNENYLRAEYRSRLFRFVDDVEFRLDSENDLLHIRSGSRSGTSDLGVNRKRVENLRQLLTKFQ